MMMRLLSLALSPSNQTLRCLPAALVIQQVNLSAKCCDALVSRPLSHVSVV